MFSRETRLGAPRGARGGPVKDSSKVPVYGRVYGTGVFAICAFRLSRRSPSIFRAGGGAACCGDVARRSCVVRDGDKPYTSRAS